MPSKRMPSNSNKWYCSFYYTDYQGKRKRKKKEGFETKRQADEWERDFLNNIEFNPEMNFKSLYEMYIKDIGPTLKEHTLQTKTTLIESKILPYFEKYKISDIKPIDIKRWQNQLLSHINPSTNEPYSQTYLRTINNQITAIFNYAMRYHDLKENPCLKVSKIGKKNADEMNIWTPTEFNTFINNIEDQVLHLGFNILYWGGLRIGELLALTWSDIDFNKNTISITKSYQRLKGKDIITAPKTPKSIRTISLIQTVIEEIKVFQGATYSPKNEDRIFNFTKYKFERNIKKYSLISDIKPIRLHDLRHSHTSLLIHEGINIVAISKRLGHEKVSTTLDTYSHLFELNDNEIIDKLEHIKKDFG